MKGFQAATVIASLFFLASCAVSLPDYRENGDEAFLLVCHSQGSIGKVTYNFAIDPVTKIATMKKLPQWKGREQIQLFEGIRFSNTAVNFFTTIDKLENNTPFLTMEKETGLLFNQNGSLIAKRCDDLDYGNTGAYIEQQFITIKKRWYKVGENIYQKPN